VKSNGTWKKQQVLTRTGGAPFSGFGNSVAISGTTALVGTAQQNDGAAYVFDTPTPPGTFITPPPGSILSGTSAEFEWSPVPDAAFYDLHLSTIGPGGSDLYSSGGISSTHAYVTGIPGNGEKIYARLYSWINGGWQYTDSTFTEVELAHLTSPAEGSTLTGSSQTFTWSAAPGVDLFDLHLSTVGPGASDLYSSGPVSGTSLNVTGLPTNGEKIYAKLFSRINGEWEGVDYTFTTK
jgi:hypothetical protein